MNNRNVLSYDDPIGETTHFAVDGLGENFRELAEQFNKTPVVNLRDKLAERVKNIEGASPALDELEGAARYGGLDLSRYKKWALLICVLGDLDLQHLIKYAVKFCEHDLDVCANFVAKEVLNREDFEIEMLRVFYNSNTSRTLQEFWLLNVFSAVLKGMDTESNPRLQVIAQQMEVRIATMKNPIEVKIMKLKEGITKPDIGEYPLLKRLYKLGNLCRVYGDPEEAIRYYEQVVSCVEKYPDKYFWIERNARKNIRSAQAELKAKSKGSKHVDIVPDVEQQPVENKVVEAKVVDKRELLLRTYKLWFTGLFGRIKAWNNGKELNFDNPQVIPITDRSELYVQFTNITQRYSFDDLARILKKPHIVGVLEKFETDLKSGQIAPTRLRAMYDLFIKQEAVR